MLDHLLDQLRVRHRGEAVTQRQLLRRLRQADSRLTALYRTADVSAGPAYGEAWIRSAYLLRYLPHYTLQIGDLLRDLEGDAQVAALFAQPQLNHAALCGGPAPEAIALAVLHQQAGGRRLHTLVLDQQAPHWSDCWPISASVARAFGDHPQLQISGLHADLSRPPSPEELGRLAGSQVLTLMNALNELMQLGSFRLRRSLAARLRALPSGALVLISDQARYSRCAQGMALLQRLLINSGARIMISRTSAAQAHAAQNRFELTPRLQGLYGQAAGADSTAEPQMLRFRIHNEQLQLAALMP